MRGGLSRQVQKVSRSSGLCKLSPLHSNIGGRRDDGAGCCRCSRYRRRENRAVASTRQRVNASTRQQPDFELPGVQGASTRQRVKSDLGHFWAPLLGWEPCALLLWAAPWPLECPKSQKRVNASTRPFRVSDPPCGCGVQAVGFRPCRTVRRPRSSGVGPMVPPGVIDERERGPSGICGA